MSDFSTSNPYAVTTAELADIGLTGGGDAAAIRKKFLSHEASVKSVSILYWIGGVFGIFAAITYAVVGLRFLSDPKTIAQGIVLLGMSPVAAGLSIFQIILAQALRKLKPWARIGTAVLSVIGLFFIPIGTLISAYILYLVLSQKGQYVFSPAYQRVIAATPDIKYKTSIIIWILLALVVALLVFGLVAAAVSA